MLVESVDVVGTGFCIGEMFGRLFDAGRSLSPEKEVAGLFPGTLWYFELVVGITPLIVHPFLNRRLVVLALSNGQFL